MERAQNMETCAEPALCVPDKDKNERKNPFKFVS